MKISYGENVRATIVFATPVNSITVIVLANDVAFSMLITSLL